MTTSKEEVICGDSLEIMRGFADKQFDLVLTDPPYGISGEEDFSLVKQALEEMKRVCRMQILILDWRNPLTVEDGKFAELVWEYGWISGGRTKSNHFYPTHNTIHFLGEDLFSFDTKEGSIIKRRAGFSSPRQCSYAKKSGHPYEKPVALMEYLIERSNAKSVLDPFMGSGSTLVASKKRGISATGIEINEDYCELARKRLTESKP